MENFFSSLYFPSFLRGYSIIMILTGTRSFILDIISYKNFWGLRSQHFRGLSAQTLWMIFKPKENYIYFLAVLYVKRLNAVKLVTVSPKLPVSITSSWQLKTLRLALRPRTEKKGDKSFLQH